MTDMDFQEALAVVQQGVRDLLGSDASGHADDHVERVAMLAERFALECGEAVDMQEVLLTAWLHEVDDYKLFGRAQAETLQNATDIMTKSGVNSDLQEAVRHNISQLGYKKSLHGIRPERLAGKLVSDADMCDAVGACGIERALVYAVNHDSCKIFDRTVWPDVNIDAHRYNANGGTHDGDSFINYFFEKLLKLPGIMLTEPGRKEALIRDDIMVQFLRHYFREYNVPEWSEFLEDYLSRRQSV